MQKESFKNKLLSEFEKNTSSLQTFDDLKEKAKTIFGKAPESVDSLKVVKFGRIIDIENEGIWDSKIIGKSDVEISSLIQRLNLNDWVNQGRSYIQADNICPFCQQTTITEDFKKQLEDYFDELFTASTKNISDFNGEYNRLSDNLINELTQIEIKEKSNNGTKLDVDKFSAFLKTLLSQINVNKGLLSDKIKEPSRSIKLTSTKEQFEHIEKLIVSANEEIKKHNDIVINYKTERSSLIQAIWKYIVEDEKVDIEQYENKIAGLDKGISNLKKDVDDKRKSYTTLKNYIKELTKNVTSVQPTVNEINNTLQYYGFDNFEIVPSASNESHYQINKLWTKVHSLTYD
jgi:wobble nucleotide-excising tRNase